MMAVFELPFYKEVAIEYIHFGKIYAIGNNGLLSIMFGKQNPQATVTK